MNKIDMSFIDALARETNMTHTENGALTHLTTLNVVLDFFSLAASCRNQVDMAAQLFKKAFAYDKQLAVRALFYIRDVRGGCGEREVFRKCLATISDIEISKKIALHIPVYGRWDDMFVFSDMPFIYDIIRKQLEKDIEDMAQKKPISLLAKWLPSENATSTKTKQLARKVQSHLGMTPKQYRHTLSSLRKYIKILEADMSFSLWDKIEYDTLPSLAFKKHIKAFRRHDEVRFEKFLKEVEKGEKKVNTKTLFTYQVYDLIRNDPKSANILWNNLPDYTNGKNALVIADVSGSMTGRPMSVSVSLALYFAERNKGSFHGYFMTFSASPRLQKVEGTTLYEKMMSIEKAEWGMNTDIEQAFMAILNAAKNTKAKQDELPSTLYIISDMEFDACTRGTTNFENAKKMFEEAGYTLPHVVFWNVNARQKQAPALAKSCGVTLLSGLSQTNFKYVVEGKTPEEFMLSVLNSPRYENIKI